MPKIILAAHGRITTRFGEDIGRGFLHRGIDQGHGDGKPEDLEIRAPADGVVTFAGEMGSYGLCYFITHNDGWVSVLAHHDNHLASKGQRVAQRQLIAVMGNSGTKYVHSHQELRDAAGKQLDPLLHLASTAAAAVTPVKFKRKHRDEMIYLATSSHGVINKDWRYLQGSDGRLRALTTNESSAHAFAETPEVMFAGKDVYDLMRKYGLYEYEGTVETGPQKLTGRLIFGDSADDRVYPKSQLPA